MGHKSATPFESAMGPSNGRKAGLWVFDLELFAKFKTEATGRGQTLQQATAAALALYLQPPAVVAAVPVFAGNGDVHKTCPICGTVFVSATKRQRFCGQGNRRCMKYYQRSKTELGARATDAQILEGACRRYAYKFKYVPPARS